MVRTPCEIEHGFQRQSSSDARPARTLTLKETSFFILVELRGRACPFSVGQVLESSWNGWPESVAYAHGGGMSGDPQRGTSAVLRLLGREL
jgi:hypothetical protein